MPDNGFRRSGMTLQDELDLAIGLVLAAKYAASLREHPASGAAMIPSRGRAGPASPEGTGQSTSTGPIAAEDPQLYSATAVFCGLVDQPQMMLDDRSRLPRQRLDLRRAAAAQFLPDQLDRLAMPGGLQL